MGGVNLVAGFRPELWREAAPDDAPADLVGFNEDLIGSDSRVRRRPLLGAEIGGLDGLLRTSPTT